MKFFGGPNVVLTYCNMGCTHCGSLAGRARDDELDTDECLRLADALIERFARVPVEAVFDRAFNDLFVVRIAGNVLGTEALGSFD